MEQLWKERHSFEVSVNFRIAAGRECEKEGEAEKITGNKSVSEQNSQLHNSVENMGNETPITEEIEALCS